MLVTVGLKGVKGWFLELLEYGGGGVGALSTAWKSNIGIVSTVAES